MEYTWTLRTFHLNIVQFLDAPTPVNLLNYASSTTDQVP